MTTESSAASPARPSTLSADLGMLLVALIWGINFSVTKGALVRFPPLAFTAVRFAVASVLLVPLVRHLETGPLPRRVLARLVILGVVGNTLYQVTFISGLALTTASNSALILASMPTIVALLAVGLGFEPVRPRVLAGVLIATVGVVLVVAARGAGFGPRTLAGDLLSLGAVLCWAGYTLGLRAVPGSVTPLTVTMVTTLAGTPGLVAVGIPQLLHMDWSLVRSAEWAALGYATFLSLIVAYVIWNRSVQLVGPSRTVVYMCLTPLVAVVAAAVLLGERPRPLQAVGAALIIGGVMLSRWPARARLRRHSSTTSR